MVGEHPRRLCPGHRDHAAAASQPRAVMAGLVPGAGGAPGHRRHRAARGPVRPPAGRRGIVPGERGPQARRRVGLVRLAGPARAYRRQPGRRHCPAQGRPRQLARAGPYPEPGPRTHSRRRHRTRPAARPHRSAGGGPAVHRCPGVRGHRCRRRGSRHRTGTPRAAGHSHQWPAPEPRAPRPGCFPDRRLSRRALRPDDRPGAIRHPNRGTAVCRRRMAGRAPPRRAGGPALRPGQPPRTAHDAALIRSAVPRCRQAAPRSPERHGIRRSTRRPAVRPGPAHPGQPPGPAMASRQASLPRPAASAWR